MTIYEIHALRGDGKPFRRVIQVSLEKLLEYLIPFPVEQECTAIIYRFDHKGKELSKTTFFGSRKSLLAQEVK